MEDRLRILKQIETGELTVEEGARQLQSLAQPPEPPEPPAAPVASAARPAWMEWLWQPVFWTGVALAGGGGLLLSNAYASEAGGGLVWGWLLFALGVLEVLLGWWMQRAHWLFVRVRAHDGPNVTLALPLPLGLAAGVLRLARPFVPQLAQTGVDEMILALREEVRGGSPLVVDVDERESGESVQVYFG